MKRTDWYSANIKPVRKGWYEVAFCGNKQVIEMGYWSGKRWQWYTDSDYQAAIYGNYGDLWRGLAKEQK